MLSPADFFDLSTCAFSDLFDDVIFVWEALQRIPDYIHQRIVPKMNGALHSLAIIEGDVQIGAGTVVEAGAVIIGPTIIGENCEVRAGAYIRGNVLVGDRVVVGHTTELKTCILFNDASVPHFSYVGDSILGYKAHLGAGVKISNYKINAKPVVVKIENKRYETGLLKFGAILGDEVEIGCNAVLNPGTIIGKRTMAYATASLLGYYPPDCVVKVRQTHQIVSRKD